MRTATITINTAALTHNLNEVKRLAPKSKVLAMVKADAYGHGLENCLTALNAADAIGVATFAEAKQARLLGWDKRIIMIEGAFTQEEWQRCHNFEITCVAHQQAQIEWALTHIPDRHSPSRTLWLKVNTGMNRLGFKPSQIIPIAKRLQQAGYHLILISHFANADDTTHPLNQQQISTFDTLLKQLHTQVSATIEASLCNSAGIIHFSNCHYDWVRPGIMLYGSSPSVAYSARALNLRAVMCFAAKLMAILPVQQGASVGYGSTFTCNQDMILGLVSVGYGDGYPRVGNATNVKAWVGLPLADKVYACAIIGRVSMDMLAIDLTDVPNANINDAVVLWGDETLGYPSVDDVATSANTISYELLCRLSQRPSRHLI